MVDTDAIIGTTAGLLGLAVVASVVGKIFGGKKGKSIFDLKVEKGSKSKDESWW